MNKENIILPINVLARVALLVVLVCSTMTIGPCATSEPGVAALNLPQEKNEIHVVVMAPGDSDLFSYREVMPAVQMAVQGVDRFGLLSSRRIHLSCLCGYDLDKTDPTLLDLVDAYQRDKVDVVIGPIGDYFVAPVARFCKTWNIPVISPGAFASDFADKENFPMLTRAGPVDHSSMARMFLQMMNYYGWTKIMMIHERGSQDYVTPSFCTFEMQALWELLRKNGIHVDYVVNKEINPESVLKEKIGNNYSVIAICASPDTVRELMIKAHELNFDNGEYIFFNVDLAPKSLTHPWYRDTDTQERNENASKAFEALQTVTLRRPASMDYSQFSYAVKRRAMAMYANYTPGEENVSSFVGAFHDAMILYASALNESLEANLPITDGRDITRKMWNKTFQGIGGSIHINDNGDRTGDYSLLSMDPHTREMNVVANFYGNRQQYEPVSGKSIYWVGGIQGPPSDTPICGFDWSNCLTDNNINSK